MAGSVTITGMSASEPTGQRTIGPITDIGTIVVGETLAVALASGDNTFAVPLGSVACLIMPPTNGTVALKLRTNLNAADVGLPIPSIGRPLYYPFPSPAPTSLIVNASGAQAAFLTLEFI